MRLCASVGESRSKFSMTLLASLPGPCVLQDRLRQVRRASVVKEEHSLADSPQRSRSELVRPGAALRDAVGKSAYPYGARPDRRRDWLAPVKAPETYPEVAVVIEGVWQFAQPILVKSRSSRLNLRRAGRPRARRSRLVEEAHEVGECIDVGRSLGRGGRIENCAILRCWIEEAAGRNRFGGYPRSLGKSSFVTPISTL